MMAAVLPDIDGVGIIAGMEYYSRFHQKLGHNLPFVMTVALLVALMSSSRWKVFWLCLLAGHLHLLMDLLGSGLGWGFNYLNPIGYYRLTALGWWELASWQNALADAFLLSMTLLIMIRKRRFLFEYPFPRLDQRIVTWCTTFKR